jgi:hypothetical protein
LSKGFDDPSLQDLIDRWLDQESDARLATHDLRPHRLRRRQQGERRGKRCSTIDPAAMSIGHRPRESACCAAARCGVGRIHGCPPSAPTT